MSGSVFHIAALFFLCLVSAFAQVLLKKASQKEYPSLLLQYLNPYVIIGYGLFFLVLVANIYLLRFIPMSVMSAVGESMPLILSFVTGRIFFGEKVGLAKLLGGLLVVAGIVIVVA